MEILQIYANDYVDIASHLQIAVNKLAEEEASLNDPVFCGVLDGTIEELGKLCDVGELPVTKVKINRTLHSFRAIRDKGNPMSELFAEVLPAHMLAKNLEEIRATFIDELATKFYFQLPNQKKEHFEIPQKGWEKVIERFPDAVTDIEEMSKCFALSRYPGAVFHSLLVVEVGLIALGIELRATDPKAGWDATCKRLHDLMTGGHKAYPSDLRIPFSIVEQINQSAQAMKHAWRNKVSHAAGKLVVLKSDFTPDIAEEIIFATRGFMRTLASDLPTKQSV